METLSLLLDCRLSSNGTSVGNTTWKVCDTLNINATGSNGLSINGSTYVNGSMEFNPGNDTETAQFFSHYYAKDRFIMECSLAIIAFLINTVSFGTNNLKEHQHYAYYALFRNLTMANSMFCLTLFLSNNMLLLIHVTKIRANMCHMISSMTFALIGNTLFGLMSTMTLLGFSLVHYLAVCHPLTYPLRINQVSIKTTIGLTWVSLITMAAIPTVMILIKISTSSTCSISTYIEIADLSRYYATVSVGILQLVVILIIAFCVRIHLEIRRLQSRLSQYRWMDEMELEKKTFRSILLLVCTLIIFFVPFNVMYVVSLNQGTEVMMNNKFVVYYMTLSLYLKFILDPVLYRKTLIDIQASLKAFCLLCMCCFCCDCRKRRKERLAYKNGIVFMHKLPNDPVNNRTRGLAAL